jgi:hypothetical protein
VEGVDEEPEDRFVFAEEGVIDVVEVERLDELLRGNELPRDDFDVCEIDFAVE